MATPLAGRPDPARREPLWDRVDRNRLRLIAYLAVFAAICAVFVAGGIAAVAAVVFLVALYLGALDAVAPALLWLFGGGFWRLWTVALACSFAYEAWALSRSERWLLQRLGAVFVPKGAELDAKMSLKDMAIAAGLPVAPALHVIETTNVNAFVFKAPGRRPVLGATRGLLTRLERAEQRAVFANLVARLRSGDTTVSSALTSLLAPLQWYRSYRMSALDIEDEMMRRHVEELKSNPLGQGSSPAPASALLLPFLAPLILAGEILAAMQRRSQLTAAEKADAEGMLLLKDPDAMISALERCVRFNNVVVEAGEALGDLFYCWTGDSTDDERDPEWRRVARLREVLGVWGWVPDDVPATDTAGEAGCLPPKAPRLEPPREG